MRVQMCGGGGSEVSTTLHCCCGLWLLPLPSTHMPNQGLKKLLELRGLEPTFHLALINVSLWPGLPLGGSA